MNLEHLSRADLIQRAKAKRVLELREDGERLGQSLTEFTRAAWPQLERKRYLHNWHIDAIGEHLEAVTRREIKRLIVNVPFRTMKSTLVDVAWPAWIWANDPSHQFLCGSHAEKLATRDNLKHRRLISSPWYKARWGHKFSLTGDQNQKLRFENDKGGYRIGFGMTSGITGDGGDTVIIDDPHDRDKAQSEVREKALETFDQSIVTRLNDPDESAIVVIMQRLHERDLSGHLLESDEDWVHLMLPMEYDSSRHCVTCIGFSDPRGSDEDGEPLPIQERSKRDGELLWPQRFPADAVSALKTRLGTYGTSGQLQQIPTPVGGGLFKRDWWQCWDDKTAARMGVKPGRLPPFSYVLGILDTAYTEKEENDPSAMTILGLWQDEKEMPQVMLMFGWEEWLEFNPLVEKVAQCCKDFKVDRLLIESKASGLSVAQEMRRRYSRAAFGVETADPGKSDKVARAMSVTHLFEDSCVWAPGFEDGTWRTWAAKVIDQMAGFPKASHDDLTDTVVMGLKYLRDTGRLLRPEEHVQYVRDQMEYQKPARLPYDA